jgi:hypothetical protein
MNMLGVGRMVVRYRMKRSPWALALSVLSLLSFASTTLAQHAPPPAAAGDVAPDTSKVVAPPAPPLPDAEIVPPTDPPAAVVDVPPTASLAGEDEVLLETKWGATAYGGGDVDSLGNVQFGLKGSYRILQLASLARFSPEIGVEFRKNFLLVKAGARGDTRELARFSLFGGAGVLHIRDFTNDTENATDETWYVDFGAKYRLPSLAGTPILGPIFENLPLENVALFLAEELTGLEEPDVSGTVESRVDEWYPYSVYFGFMVGSAAGWPPSGRVD